jgi:RND family efflux transporter MFP subunit
MTETEKLSTPAPKAPPPSAAPEGAVKTQHAPRRRSATGLVFAALICAGLGIAVYFGIQSRAKADAETKQAALETLATPVMVVHPQKGSKADEITLPGNTQAFSDTAIYARTSGYLKNWKVDIGDHVKQDQLLAEIETPEVDQQLDQAQAERKNAQANLEISQITFNRLDALFKKAAVSHQDRDQAASDLASRKAQFDSADANVRRLQKLQAFEKVYAPFDGVITARNTDVGSLIQAGDNTSAKELFHLASVKTLRVYVSVPEVYAASVKNGQKADVSFDASPSQVYSGTIVRNSGSIEQHSRTLNVEVDVDNPKEELYPGGYATVKFKLPPSADSFTIPSNTLLFRSEGLRIAVVRDGHAQLVPIKIGHDFGSTVEVLSGITAQDAIILDPSDSLADGAAVHVEEPKASK